MSGDYPNSYPSEYPNNGYNYSTYHEGIDYYLPFYMLMILCFCSLSACLHEYYNKRNHSIIRQPLILNKKEVKNEALFTEGCVICLERYQKNDKIVTLKCNHIFHIECIEEWFKSKKSCPLCRLSLL